MKNKELKKAFKQLKKIYVIEIGMYKLWWDKRKNKTDVIRIMPSKAKGFYILEQVTDIVKSHKDLFCFAIADDDCVSVIIDALFD